MKVYSAYSEVPSLALRFPVKEDKKKTLTALENALKSVLKARGIEKERLYEEGTDGQGTFQFAQTVSSR